MLSNAFCTYRLSGCVKHVLKKSLRVLFSCVDGNWFHFKYLQMTSCDSFVSLSVVICLILFSFVVGASLRWYLGGAESLPANVTKMVDCPGY